LRPWCAANQVTANPVTRTTAAAIAANRRLVVGLPRFMLYQIVENILSYGNSRRWIREKLKGDTRMRPPELLSRTESSPALRPLDEIQREGTKALHAKDLPNATSQPFKVWHPSHLKTGLRNHPIGRKIALTALPDKLVS
jgi:hypothetical protein